MENLHLILDKNQQYLGSSQTAGLVLFAMLRWQPPQVFRNWKDVVVPHGFGT